MRGKGGAGDLPCRGARGTLSGGQCEGAPCLSLFPKGVGWLCTRKRLVLTVSKGASWQELSTIREKPHAYSSPTPAPAEKHTPETSTPAWKKKASPAGWTVSAWKAERTGGNKSSRHSIPSSF